MSNKNRYRKIALNKLRDTYSRFPFPGVSRPVFIVGCGRSGTTIFGTVLSQHDKVAYLNEPRRLWFSAYPETDIWTPAAEARQGRLAFVAEDAERKKSLKLSRSFRFETLKRRKPVLIEKLPINNFRLDFIYHIFPDARFIHLYRNGLEVARSIEKYSREGRWFGTDAYKWNQLVGYAADRPDVQSLPELCRNNFEKGLLEWRLSSEAVVHFLKKIPRESCFELSYAQLVEQPENTMSKVLDFIGLSDQERVLNFAVNNLSRKTTPLKQQALSKMEKILGGQLLPLSLDSEKSLMEHLDQGSDVGVSRSR
ncbi:MAG: sulfotransferase [Cyanobacteria bacterium J06634_5]